MGADVYLKEGQGDLVSRLIMRITRATMLMTGGAGGASSVATREGTFRSMPTGSLGVGTRKGHRSRCKLWSFEDGTAFGLLLLLLLPGLVDLEFGLPSRFCLSWLSLQLLPMLHVNPPCAKKNLEL